MLQRKFQNLSALNPNIISKYQKIRHCVKSVQTRSIFWSVFSPNVGKYRPENTPYLDTFHTFHTVTEQKKQNSALLTTLNAFEVNLTIISKPVN